jgi:hypothetical protein
MPICVEAVAEAAFGLVFRASATGETMKSWAVKARTIIKSDWRVFLLFMLSSFDEVRFETKSMSFRLCVSQLSFSRQAAKPQGESVR